MKKGLLVFSLVMFCIISFLGTLGTTYFELPPGPIVISNSIEVTYIELPPGPIVVNSMGVAYFELPPGPIVDSNITDAA